jgi:hypothetical protein
MQANWSASRPKKTDPNECELQGRGNLPGVRSPHMSCIQAQGSKGGRGSDAPRSSSCHPVHASTDPAQPLQYCYTSALRPAGVRYRCPLSSHQSAHSHRSRSQPARKPAPAEEGLHGSAGSRLLPSAHTLTPTQLTHQPAQPSSPLLGIKHELANRSPGDIHPRHPDASRKCRVGAADRSRPDMSPCHSY